MNSRSHTCDRCGSDRLIHIPQGKVSTYYGVTYIAGRAYVCLFCEVELTPYLYTFNGGPFSVPDILWHVPVGWHATVLGALEQLVALGWHRMLNHAIAVTPDGQLKLSLAVPPWALDVNSVLRAHLVMLKAEQACSCRCYTCGHSPTLLDGIFRDCGPCYARGRP